MKCDTVISTRTFPETNWCRTVYAILDKNRIHFDTSLNTDKVYSLLFAIAIVDIVSPLSIHRNLLKYIDYATDGLDAEQKTPAIMQSLTRLCISPDIQPTEIKTTVNEINPSSRSDTAENKKLENGDQSRRRHAGTIWLQSLARETSQDFRRQNHAVLPPQAHQGAEHELLQPGNHHRRSL